MAEAIALLFATLGAGIVFFKLPIFNIRIKSFPIVEIILCSTFMIANVYYLRKIYDFMGINSWWVFLLSFLVNILIFYILSSSFGKSKYIGVLIGILTTVSRAVVSSIFGYSIYFIIQYISRIT